MSLIRLYVRHERLILPTVAETEAGFYVDMEPIDVFEIHELEKWRQELYLRLAMGNPLVPTPERSDDPGSAILERLNITKWSTFETSAIMYTIHSGGRYISIYRTGKGVDGMWTQDKTDLRQFASRTPLSWIAQTVAEDVVKQPEAKSAKNKFDVGTTGETRVTAVIGDAILYRVGQSSLPQFAALFESGCYRHLQAPTVIASIAKSPARTNGSSADK